MTTRKIAGVALYADVRREDAIEAARAIASLAKRNGVGLMVGPQQAAKLQLNGAASDRFPESADLLVSLGGDGTLLRAAHLAGPLGIPVIGVDFGRVGFLSELERCGYEPALEEIFKGGARTVAHIALDVGVKGREERYYAVNDVHIDRKHHGHIVNFGIVLNGEPVASIPADGVVVATAIGSTAYFLSAGGPIMQPELSAIGIAPICPHTLFSRPLIVSADETIAITISEEGSGTELFVDGQAVVELQGGATVQVVRAARPIEFVRLHSGYFFQTLERKLHWGMSVKRGFHEGP